MTLCEVFSYYLCLQSPDTVVIGDRGSGETGDGTGINVSVVLLDHKSEMMDNTHKSRNGNILIYVKHLLSDESNCLKFGLPNRNIKRKK